MLFRSGALATTFDFGAGLAGALAFTAVFALGAGLAGALATTLDFGAGLADFFVLVLGIC